MIHLRDARKACKKTQQQIADYLEIEQTHYSAYELEKNKLSIDRYMQLAIYYNVSIDYLYGLTDQPRTLTGISWEDNVAIKRREGN